MYVYFGQSEEVKYNFEKATPQKRNKKRRTKHFSSSELDTDSSNSISSSKWISENGSDLSDDYVDYVNSYNKKFIPVQD